MNSVRFESLPRLPICLILAFGLAVLPWTLLPSISHPDERHYLTGAKEMLRSGDWVTPRTATGELRFCKPGLTYWVTAVGMFFGGDNRLATRLPFLLMGCGVVAATACGAVLMRQISANRETSSETEPGTASLLPERSYTDTAALAAGIMATHFPLWRATLQSTPDIAQCLSLVIATVGMIRFLSQADNDRADVNFRRNAPEPGAIDFAGRSDRCADSVAGRGLFWIGTAFAIAAKGLPGCLFLAYSLLFVAFRPHGTRAVGRLLCTPALPVAAVIAAGWFVAGTVLHGSQAVTGFLQDQLTTRVTNDPLDAWWQLPTAVVLPWLMLLPWSLEPLFTVVRGITRSVTLLRGGRSRKATTQPATGHTAMPPMQRILTIAGRSAASLPASSRFIVGWWLLVSGLMGFTETFSTRYALLTTPALAMLMANWFVSAANRVSLSIGRNGTIDRQAFSFRYFNIAAVGIRASSARLAVRFGHHSRWLVWLPAVVGCGLNMFAVPDSAGMIASEIAEMTRNAQVEVTYLGHPHLASRLQQALPENTPITLLRYGFPVRNLRPSVLVCNRADARWFDLTTYDHRVLRAGYRRIDVKDFLSAMWNGTLNLLYYERQQEIVIAVRRDEFEPESPAHRSSPRMPNGSDFARHSLAETHDVDDHDRDVLNSDDLISNDPGSRIQLVSATQLLEDEPTEPRPKQRRNQLTPRQQNLPVRLSAERPGDGPKLIVPKTKDSISAGDQPAHLQAVGKHPAGILPARLQPAGIEQLAPKRSPAARLPLRRFRVTPQCCGQPAGPQSPKFR